MPRKLCREIAVDRAITVFWDHGYRATSMEMLTEALGIAKVSIYANFGNKKALYLKAFEIYHNSLMARVSHDLQQAGSSTRESLDRLIRDLMTPDQAQARRGSMATNSALEMADLDPDIRACVNKTFNELLEIFTHAIGRGQQEGGIRNDLPAGALAHFLVSNFQGVRVLEKTSVETAHWRESARLTLAVLDPPATTRRRPAPQHSIRTQVAAGRGARTVRTQSGPSHR